MADTVTSSNILGVGIEYTDTASEKVKTVYMKIPNPKTGITEAQIKAGIGKFFSPAILRDIYGEPIQSTSIITAYRETTTKTEIDIT